MFTAEAESSHFPSQGFWYLQSPDAFHTVDRLNPCGTMYTYQLAGEEPVPAGYELYALSKQHSI